MYHYCRSILCDSPFAGGIENLSLLFDKNAKTFEKINGTNRQQLLMAASAGATAQERRKKELSAKMKLFLISFVRLHGVLFTWTKSIRQVIASSTSPSDVAKGFADVAPINFDDWDLLLRDVLSDFDELLMANAFGDYILVRLVVVGIFSVHFSSFPSMLDDSASKLRQRHSMVESMALVALFSFVNK